MPTHHLFKINQLPMESLTALMEEGQICREREREWMHNKGNSYVMTCHHAITRSARRLLSELNWSLTFTHKKRERERESEKEKWTVIMSWWVICLCLDHVWSKKRARQVTWEERRMLETLHAVRMSLLNTDDWVKRERGRVPMKVIFLSLTVSHDCLSPARFMISELCSPTV